MTSERRVVRVAIVGGGISGIAAAVKLKEKIGSTAEITIFERGTSPGGVWRDAVWPGAGVDIPIHLYQLYSELNPNWSVKFAERPEVMAYWDSIIDKYHLRDCFRFKKEFVSSRWDNITQSHTLEFSDSSTFVADVIISAAGALNTPIVPKLPGIEEFEGKQWHSANWDRDVDLKGKRVAIVGNGSSGIQVVPNIADVEGIQITQFIRSPGFFTPKVQRSYSALEKFAFRWIPGVQRLYRWRLFYRLDFASLTKGTGIWSSIFREKTTASLVNYLKKTAPAKYHDLLIPKYPLHCKRVAYNAGWLESLHKPNINLIGTTITGLTPTGIQTIDGVVHEFDVIVWATGFDVARTGVGLNHGVYGQDGKELAEVWTEQEGASAYLAVAVPKYPNFFFVLGPNAISMSWGYTIGSQTEHISRLVQGLVQHNLSSISPTVEAARAYNAKVQARLNQTVLVSPACTAWYRYKGVGKVIAPSGFSGTELTIRTARIKWEDWEARRIVRPGEKAEIVPITTPSIWNPFTLLYLALGARLERHLLKITTV